jgi:hypothetical protein
MSNANPLLLSVLCDLCVLTDLCVDSVSFFLRSGFR